MFNRFLSDTSGAVTVDWVVLTAAITGLGLASAAAVRTGTGALAGDIQTSLSGASVAAILPFVYSGRYSGGDYAAYMARENTFLDAELLPYLEQAYTMFQALENPDNYDEAAEQLDFYAAMHDIATQRGLEIPDGYPSVEALDTRYQVLEDTFYGR